MIQSLRKVRETSPRIDIGQLTSMTEGGWEVDRGKDRIFPTNVSILRGWQRRHLFIASRDSI